MAAFLFFSLSKGCGSGKYLGSNPQVFIVGSDHCLALAKIARNKDHEVKKKSSWPFQIPQNVDPCFIV